MRHRSRNMLGYLIIACTCVACLLAAPAWSTEPNKLHIVLSSNDAVYNNILKSITDTLEKSGQLKSHSLSSVTVQEIMSSNHFAPDAADLVVSVGTRATQLVNERNLSAAHLSVFIPKTTFEKIVGNDHAPGKRSAIFLDQPLNRRLSLTRIIMPKSRNLGALLGPISGQKLPELATQARLNGFHLNTVKVNSEDRPASAMKQLLNENDVILAIHDPIALNTKSARWFLYMAYQRNIPVIGYSKSYVKAGAVAAVYSEPVHIGRQAGEIITQWIRRGYKQLPAPAYPEYYDVSINHAIAKSFGIRFSGEQVVTHMKKNGR